MATTLGGATLREPADFTLSDITPQSQKRMADGTIKTASSSTTKRQWALIWNNCTTAERDTIAAKGLVVGAQVFSPPDTGSSYTVHVASQSYNHQLVKVADGESRWIVNLTVVQE